MSTDAQTLLDEWFARLIVEFRQAERSAIEHPPLEAERLGQDSPPAMAMRAVAADARASLAELEALLDALDLPDGPGGQVLGTGLSTMREHFIDKLVSVEASYRGTLIGMSHALDCAAMLHGVATRHPSGEPLAAWLAAWLPRREALVDGCRHALAWFPEHPDVAQRPAQDGVLARGARAVSRGVSRLIR